MKIHQLMTRDVRVCRPGDSLAKAAQIMWESDCGSVPVVETDSRKPMGMLTDRDVCMAAYTQGLPLGDIPVERAMSKAIYTCRPEDTVGEVEDMMREMQVRRLPVTDDEGHLVGIVSLTDIVRHAQHTVSRTVRTVNRLGWTDIATTLAAVSLPRSHGHDGHG